MGEVVQDSDSIEPVPTKPIQRLDLSSPRDESDTPRGTGHEEIRAASTAAQDPELPVDEAEDLFSLRTPRYSVAGSHWYPSKIAPFIQQIRKLQIARTIGRMRREYRNDRAEADSEDGTIRVKLAFAKKLFRNNWHHRIEQSTRRDIKHMLPVAEDPSFNTPFYHGLPYARKVVDVRRGRMLATIACNSDILLHDAIIGSLPSRRLVGQEGEIFALASLGENLLATGGEKSIAIWDVSDGGLVKEVSTREAVTALIALDTRHILAGSGRGMLAIYAHDDGRTLREVRSKNAIHEGRVWDLAKFENLVVSTSEDRGCALLDIRNLRCIGRWKHRHSVTAAAINKSYIVTGSIDTLRVRRRRDELMKTKVWLGAHGGQWIHQLILLKDDQLLSFGGDGNIVLHDLEREIPICRIKSGLGGVCSAALLPQKRVAVCGAWDNRGYLLDLTTFLSDSSPKSSIWNPRTWNFPNSPIRTANFSDMSDPPPGGIHVYHTNENSPVAAMEEKN